MDSHFMFDGIPPSHEQCGEAGQKDRHGAKRVPRGFVRHPSPVNRPEKPSPDEQIGAALDERSFESLQRIARYLGIEGTRDFSRAELLARIREALSW